jgi:hypothetical protein
LVGGELAGWPPRKITTIMSTSLDDADGMILKFSPTMTSSWDLTTTMPNSMSSKKGTGSSPSSAQHLPSLNPLSELLFGKHSYFATHEQNVVRG